MLQQTQAARAVPAFERFMARFPTPESFAAASAADVIASWGNLGYLRRARNLHAAARSIAADGWPEHLADLPGVGRYTAAAIAAFADAARVAAIDINLRRVLSRWEGRLLSERAAAARGLDLVDPRRPGDWNQAMMDLGAQLCRPAPRCGPCPVAEWCSDPGIQVTGGRQGRFAGSVRQARAAVLKSLVDGPRTESDLVRDTGLDVAAVTEAIGALANEGAIVRRGARWQLG